MEIGLSYKALCCLSDKYLHIFLTLQRRRAFKQILLLWTEEI
jgi:hypothetical protein